MAQAIIRSAIDFRRDPWPRVSDNAKDLVKRMLDPDPKRRLTAQEVLGTNLHFLLNHVFFCGVSLCLRTEIDEVTAKAKNQLFAKSQLLPTVLESDGNLNKTRFY